jgi:preprotein translocase subunit SecE
MGCTGSREGPGGGPMFARRPRKEVIVAKTTPIEFIRQVQAETRKVVWPTRRETIMTGVMVMIMTVLLGLFFFGIDSVFDAIVRGLLSLAN